MRQFDLRFDLEAREQRHLVLVELQPLQLVRHHVFEMRARLLVDVLVVDHHLADVRAQVVAQGAQDDVVFLVDQERPLALGGRLLDRVPDCLLYTSPSPRDKRQSRMPSSA